MGLIGEGSAAGFFEVESCGGVVPFGLIAEYVIVARIFFFEPDCFICAAKRVFASYVSILVCRFENISCRVCRHSICFVR